MTLVHLKQLFTYWFFAVHILDFLIHFFTALLDSYIWRWIIIDLLQLRIVILSECLIFKMFFIFILKVIFVSQWACNTFKLIDCFLWNQFVLFGVKKHELRLIIFWCDWLNSLAHISFALTVLRWQFQNIAASICLSSIEALLKASSTQPSTSKYSLSIFSWRLKFLAYFLSAVTFYIDCTDFQFFLLVLSVYILFNKTVFLFVFLWWAWIEHKWVCVFFLTYW